MLAEATGWERAALVADPGAELAPAASRLFGEMVRRRLRREPVAYIVGRKGFRQIELAVDRRVLIPRPETELLVEVALERAPATAARRRHRLRRDRPGRRRRAAGLRGHRHRHLGRRRWRWRAANADRLGLEPTRPLPRRHAAARREDFDLILANLPYVAEPDWPSLQPEVTEWEPREALLAGPDGLDAIRALIPRESEVGTAGAEVGEGQARGGARAAARGRASARSRPAATWPGIERVVVGER